MKEDILFHLQGQIKITAASICVSKSSWKFVKEVDNHNIGDIQQMMEENRIDNLPIVSNDGVVRKYYKTNNPNQFQVISQIVIKYEDTIPFDNNIREVIEKFHFKKRTFFFVRFQNEISGILTISDLNCKQILVYLFSFICELERELGKFLTLKLTDEEIINWIEEKKENKYNNILRFYQKAKKDNFENPIIEYLYFLDFFTIIEAKSLYKCLGFENVEDWTNYKNINSLRNIIMHPTNRLIARQSSLSDLYKKILLMEDLIFRLTMLKLK